MKRIADQVLTYNYLFKWVLLALVSGLVSSFLVHYFLLIIDKCNSYLQSISKVPLFLWSIPAAIIVGGIIYRIERRAQGEGIPSYINGLKENNGCLPISVTIGKFFAAIITLGAFGNGGVVGPVGRVSSGVISFLAQKASFFFNKKEDMRTASICGMAAAIGTIFHSSIGAGIFAVEIIEKKSLGYKDIFPAILSSSFAVLISHTLGWKHFYPINIPNEFMDPKYFFHLVLLAILAGAIGTFYIRSYQFTSKIFNRNAGNILIKVLIGSFLAAFIGWNLDVELMGTSTNLVGHIINNNFQHSPLLHDLPIVLILIIMIFGKLLCNCLTVGSGMSAGFTGPAVIMGMLLGMMYGHFFDLPFGTPTFYAFIAGGFAGVLTSSMNVPLASAIMTIEIFGLHYSFPAGIVTVISFQLTRESSIYSK